MKVMDPITVDICNTNSDGDFINEDNEEDSVTALFSTSDSAGLRRLNAHVTSL